MQHIECTYNLPKYLSYQKVFKRYGDSLKKYFFQIYLYMVYFVKKIEKTGFGDKMCIQSEISKFHSECAHISHFTGSRIKI